MPYISFQSGRMTDDMKKKLIQKLTDISSEITGIPRSYFFVCIQDLPNENIAIGGEDVNEMRTKLARSAD